MMFHYVPNIYPLSTYYLPTIYPLSTHYLPTIYPISTHRVPIIYPTSVEHPWNIHGTSMEHPWNIHGTSTQHPRNIHGTSTEHPPTAVFESFLLHSENLFNSVHFVRKCSLCSKTSTMFENVQKRRKVIKCGQMWSRRYLSLDFGSSLP